MIYYTVTPGELIALCLAIIGLIILLAVTYYCKNAERNEHLARIDQLERTLRQHDGVEDMLRGYLKAERERSAKYIQIEKDIGQANDKLRDIEGRYAEAEKEIEFWRCKDSVSAAADAYYTLGLDYKEEIARFGSVIAWVDHLKSVYDQVKPIAGMIQHDSEN